MAWRTLLDQLKSLEIELQQQEIRSDPVRITQLLHPEFIEIGYSGTTYDFKSIFDSMLNFSSDSKLWSQDFAYVEYASDVVQLIYLSANIDERGNLSRHAKRSSIWVSETGNWQMKFHQGTPVSVFDKSKVK